MIYDTKFLKLKMLKGQRVRRSKDKNVTSLSHSTIYNQIPNTSPATPVCELY